MSAHEAPRSPGVAGWAAAVVAAWLMVAGCGGPGVPPPIVLDTPCATCGMGVQDLRFACQRRVDRGWRVYDAIECLLRDAAGSPGSSGTVGAWLADYDRQTLHAADSMWVVRGEFASPMGGGMAAFHERAAADSIAAATGGQVDRLAAFVRAPARAAP